MRPTPALALAFLACSGLAAASASARPIDAPELATETVQPDRAGVVDGGSLSFSKVLQDTTWIADWSFDVTGGGCTDAGWVRYDNRILNDGSNLWSVNNGFDGFGGIVSNAAVLAKHDLSWVHDGYGNDWDYSIILKYQGVSTLTFSYLSDSEPGFDFINVEIDSGGLSESLVDFTTDPEDEPERHRVWLLSIDGPHDATLGPLTLTDFGAPTTTHEAYIRFVSDGGYSDEDGLYATDLHAGLVVDDIMVYGALTYSEDFEGPLGSNVILANTASATPFGEWARLYEHITDNDRCTGNPTCAWLWSDPTLPAYFPNMAFGPGGAVVRSWLDDIVVSPWVNLMSTPGTSGTVLAYRRFKGNEFGLGGIAQNWSFRARVRLDNTDTSTLGDSIDSVSPWLHRSYWNALSEYVWKTELADMSAYIPANTTAIQVRFRLADYWLIASPGAPRLGAPGPGPFIDRVRIGRRVLTGPVLDPGIDVRSQAQDCFPTHRNAIVPGEHFSPSTDRFGTAAFSMGRDIASTSVPYPITGDSILMVARDVRGAGGVTEIRWYGAITRGPHAGKAPAPYTVGTNEFFEVTPDSCRGSGGQVTQDLWFVDLDDTYFRGGDVLLYFWTATDAAGGRGSFPQGIAAANFPPPSLAEAELATGGLVEVSFLPTIDWSPTYLDRIAADEHGDLDPTPTELAESRQATCILYCAAGFGGGNGRRSGEINRTSFMYTLDRLGYRGYYDVYDHQGYGNTNNQLGGRATVPQCTGYALIVHDTGRGVYPDIPDGHELDSEKIDQCQWYRDYLAQGLVSRAGIASLWLIGEDNAFSKASNPLIATDLGLGSVIDGQGLRTNPDVEGVAAFGFSNGNMAHFGDDLFALNGGCVRGSADADYDAAEPSGTSVATHRYSSGTTIDGAAVILNQDATLGWNSIWMGFGWIDIRDPSGGSPVSGTGTPDTRLARTILNAVLPVGCVQGENPTGTPEAETEAVPTVEALHPNVPNPFNPTTVIRFDLPQDGHVQLQVFDVGGRLVTTLLEEPMTRGFAKSVTWSGLDNEGRRIPSGVYFCKLTTGGASVTRKIVALQ